METSRIAFACPSCGYRITQKQYDKTVIRGREIVLHGFKYRLEYENQYKKHGRIVSKFSFHEPTIVEAAVAIIVSGVVGNAAYDAVKIVLHRLYEEIRKRRSKNRRHRAENRISAADADLVFKLIGNDPDFEKQFVNYVREYVGKKQTTSPVVASALLEERTFDKHQFICQNDPDMFVYAGKRSTRFHRKSCASLGTPKRRLRVKAAILSQLLPCKKCEPLHE